MNYFTNDDDKKDKSKRGKKEDKKQNGVQKKSKSSVKSKSLRNKVYHQASQFKNCDLGSRDNKTSPQLPNEFDDRNKFRTGPIANNVAKESTITSTKNKNKSRDNLSDDITHLTPAHQKFLGHCSLYCEIPAASHVVSGNIDSTHELTNIDKNIRSKRSSSPIPCTSTQMDDFPQSEKKTKLLSCNKYINPASTIKNVINEDCISDNDDVEIIESPYETINYSKRQIQNKHLNIAEAHECIDLDNFYPDDNDEVIYVDTVIAKDKSTVNNLNENDKTAINTNVVNGEPDSAGCRVLHGLTLPFIANVSEQHETDTEDFGNQAPVRHDYQRPVERPLNLTTARYADEAPVENYFNQAVRYADEAPVGYYFNHAANRYTNQFPLQGYYNQFPFGGYFNQGPFGGYFNPPHTMRYPNQAPMDEFFNQPRVTYGNQSPMEDIFNQAPINASFNQHPMGENFNQFPYRYENPQPVEGFFNEGSNRYANQMPVEESFNQIPADCLNQAPVERIDEQGSNRYANQMPVEESFNQIPADCLNQAPVERIDEQGSNRYANQIPVEESFNQIPVDCLNQAPVERIDEQGSNRYANQMPVEESFNQIPVDCLNQAPVERIDEQGSNRYANQMRVAESFNQITANLLNQAPFERIHEEIFSILRRKLSLINRESLKHRLAKFLAINILTYLNDSEISSKMSLKKYLLCSMSRKLNQLIKRKWPSQNNELEIIDLENGSNDTNNSNDSMEVEFVSETRAVLNQNFLGSGRTSTERESIGECPICKDNLSANKIASTFCGHIFCLKCIEASIKISGKKCPKCRHLLTGIGYHPLFF